MNTLRQLLSILFFSTSFYLVFDSFAQGFDWYVFAGAVVFYLAAYYTWPKSDKEADSAWLDIAEIIVELPFRLVATLLRGLGRAFSNKGGPDFDIDI